MGESRSKYKEIVTKLKTTRRKEINTTFLAGSFHVLSISILVFFAAVLIETIANGDTVVRSALAASVLLSFIAAAYYYLYPVSMKMIGFRKLPSVEIIALRVGNFYPDIKDKLSNVIQLYSSMKNPSVGVSYELALAAFDQTASSAADKNYNVIIEKKDFKKGLLFFIISAALLLSTILPFDVTRSAAERIILFNESFVPPAPFTLTIQPDYETVLRGSKAEIDISASGKAPATVTLHIKERQQNEYDKYTLKSNDGKNFHFELTSLKNPISFYASAEWLSTEVSTDVGRIDVVDKPIIRSLNGTLTYPSYTGLGSKDFDENNADLNALNGSYVKLNIVSNKALQKAVIYIIRNRLIKTTEMDSVLIDTVVVEMKTNDVTASGGFRITSSGSYFVKIYDVENMNNDSPIIYNISASFDSYPTISMIQPPFDVKLRENALLPIVVAVSDDYGFSSLKLHYRLAESNYTMPDKEFTTIDIPFETDGLTAEIPYLWDLNEIDIAPDDKYDFYLEIFDNDIVGGPKSAKTRVLSARLPSMNEVLNEADETHKVLQKDLEKILKEANDVNKDLEKLNREMLQDKNKKELNWEQKKKAEDIMNRQKEMRDELSNVKKKFENMTNQLSEKKLLSDETLQKFKELQELLDKVNSPELERLQKKMEQAMENVKPEDIQKAMKEAKFNEEDFKKSIERTIKILKRLQAEQKVDALTKRAEELLEKQKELEKQTENTNPGDEQKKNELAEQQKSNIDKLDNMTDDLKDLEDLMKELGDDMPLDQLQEAKNKLNTDQTKQQMQESAQQAQQGNLQQSKQSQQKANKSLKDFAEQMKKLQQEMQKKNMKEAIRKMQKAVSDMLELSEQQESLQQSTQSSDYNSTMLPDYARQQSVMLQALQNVANSMLKLSEKSFAFTPEMGKDIGDAMMEMQKSIDQLTERRTGSASKAQGAAMSSMNSAVSQMQKMVSAMQQQGSGSCDNPGGLGQGKPGPGNFGDQLHRMAAQQQGINQALRQLSQNKGSLTSEQQAGIKRLGNQQGQAGKSLQDLAREQQEAAGSKKALGDVNKIAKEMQEVAQDLETGNITPETLKRQDRILSRLLDAARSVYDRDFEKKRESKVGKNYKLTSPDDIDLTTQEGKTRAMQELLRSIKEGYTKDFEQLIQRYFESLQSNSEEIQN